MKNVIKASVKQVRDLYVSEISRLEYNNLYKIGNRANNNGGIHKCKYAIYLLDTLNDSDIVEVEGCWKDGIIRDFNLTNSGSIVECIIKAQLDKKGENYYTKSWLDSESDTKMGFLDCEIKASLDSHFKCTPAKQGKTTILVNRSGVSIIKKADIEIGARLPASGLFGNRENFMVNYLEEMLGIQGGYEE